MLALLAGEDHRFLFHRGVDPVGICRALLSTFRGRLQGASTIEQQLVRTLTGDYRLVFSRKIAEILIASTLCEILSKKAIMQAYLSVAYFGAGISGVGEGRRKLRLTGADRAAAAQLVAHLKFPKPASPTDRWHERRDRRAQQIVRRIDALKPWIAPGQG